MSNAPTDIDNEFRLMVSKLAKPGADIIMDMTAQKAHVLHMTIGIMGEAVELNTAYKNSDIDNLNEECGDLEFYLEGLRSDGFLKHCANLPGVDMVLDYAADCPIILDQAVGFYTEEIIRCAGDILDDVKKWTIYGTRKNLRYIPARVGAIARMLETIYQFSGMDRTKIRKLNIEKLAKRYPSGSFSASDAVSRADKAGTDER